MLRLVTWNLLSARTATGSHDLIAAARDLVRLDADVVALQEVDHLQPRSGAVDQVAELVAALSAPGRPWTGHFLPTVLGTPALTRTWAPATVDAAPPGAPAYGIALLSRLPVRSWHSLRWTASWGRLPMLVPTRRGQVVPLLVPDEPRAALAAEIETELGSVTVLGTHLSFLPGRAIRQLRGARQWAGRLPGPRLLLGDLNLPGQLPATVTGWRRLADARTFPAHAPRIQLDHALADGLDASVRARAEVLRGSVSDHCQLVVDLSRR
jgi:endonuclease/exonuclease/phosphatase family metal-dependent hydrolase